MKPSTQPTATPTPTAWKATAPHKKSKRVPQAVPQGLNQPHPQGLLVFQDGDGKRGDPVNEAALYLIQFQPCFKSGLVSSNLLFANGKYCTFLFKQLLT